MQATIKFKQDFSNRKEGEVMNISFDTAARLVERGVAVHHGETISKPEVVKAPPVIQSKKKKSEKNN